MTPDSDETVQVRGAGGPVRERPPVPSAKEPLLDRTTRVWLWLTVLALAVAVAAVVIGLRIG